MITETLAVASLAHLPVRTDRWKAIAGRDLVADGQFVFGVTTTGIYCRPTCPSRRPHREHVRFFDNPGDAEHAGFRACLRCKPKDAMSPARARVEKARRWLDTHQDARPTLARLARVAGVSPWHLQRSFTRLYGVSPRDYAAARRLGRLKTALRSGSSSTDAVYEAGYGSPSRVYDEVSAALGMTPSAYRAGGATEEIRYTIVDSPVGRVLAAKTARGLCRVAFGDSDAELEHELASEFPNASIARDDRQNRSLAAAVVRELKGEPVTTDLPVDIRSTAFQRRVWKALRRIPRGETRTYAEVALAIGRPGASRAVARACASNPLALVVPCHRVVPASGGTGGYRWGKERKARLLRLEQPRQRRTTSDELRAGATSDERRAGTTGVERRAGTRGVERRAGTTSDERRAGTTGVERRAGTTGDERRAGTTGVEGPTRTTSDEPTTATSAARRAPPVARR